MACSAEGHRTAAARLPVPLPGTWQHGHGTEAAWLPLPCQLSRPAPQSSAASPRSLCREHPSAQLPDPQGSHLLLTLHRDKIQQQIPCWCRAAPCSLCTGDWLPAQAPQGSTGAAKTQAKALGASKLNSALTCGSRGKSHEQLRSLHLPRFGAFPLLGWQPDGNEKPMESEQPSPHSQDSKALGSSCSCQQPKHPRQPCLKGAAAHTGEREAAFATHRAQPGKGSYHCQPSKPQRLVKGKRQSESKHRQSSSLQCSDKKLRHGQVNRRPWSRQEAVAGENRAATCSACLHTR